MILEEMNKRIQRMELLTRINSMMITDEQGNRRPLLRMNEDDIEFVDDEVSPSEYADDKVSFLQKVLQKIPLLKAGAEKKNKVEETDFINYG